MDKLPALPTYGSMRIKIGCGCALESAGRTLAEPSFPCTREDQEVTQAAYSVPISWTTLHHVKPPTPETVEVGATLNLSAILDVPWEPEISTFTELPPTEETIPDELQTGPQIATWIATQFQSESILLWSIWTIQFIVMGFIIYELTRIRNAINRV